MRMKTRDIWLMSFLGVGAVLPFVWAAAPYWGVTSIPWLQSEPTEEELAANAPNDWLSYPGVTLPETFPAEMVSIPENAEVVGIEANGLHRAYLLMGMFEPQRHIVNDVVGGIPVSVAFCNLRNCVTAYTSADGSQEPLDLGVGGLVHRQLVLSTNGSVYLQEPREGTTVVMQPDQFPHEKYPFERSTWGAWRARHPDTEIYLGSFGGYH